MTIEEGYVPESYNGNGATTEFSFDFKVNQASDIVVTHVDANGAETVLTEGTGTMNYSVSVASYPGTGSITYPATLGDELPEGESLIISRSVDLLQETDLVNQGAWKPEQVEAALDYSRMVDQQIYEEITRSLRLPISSSGVSVELPTPTADAVIGWNATADALTNLTPNTEAYLPASTYMKTVLEAETAAAARTDLGLGGLATLDAVPDEAITLAKMADLARGSFIVGGASDRPTALDGKTDGKIPMGDGTDVTMVYPPLPAGYARGCTVSLNSSDSDHDIDITAGLHRDSTDTLNITSAADTVQCDVVFGTDDGILESGSLANSTSYYLYTICKAAGADQKYFLFTGADPSSDLPTDYVYWAALNEGRAIVTDGSANLINTFHGYFQSGPLTVASAGSFSLTHALGGMPTTIDSYLICTEAELNWTVGERISVPFANQSSSVAQSVGVGATATTIRGKFTNYTYPYVYVDASSGALASMSPAKYQLYIQAWR